MSGTHSEPEAATDELTLEDVSLNVGGRWALERATLSFRPGEVTALSGPSGSGKTTMLSIAGGIQKPTTGFASYAGRHMWQGDGDPRHEVAFVLQVYGLVPILSARENVAIALRARGVRPGEADERADLELTRFHIGDLGDRQVEELSGGQMQRVACARAFAVAPQILLADEPTSELDEGNREHVMDQLRAEAARGAIVVVATHDPAVVDAADRRLVLDEGRLVAPDDELTFVGRRAVGRRAPAQHPVAPGRLVRDARAGLRGGRRRGRRRRGVQVRPHARRRRGHAGALRCGGAGRADGALDGRPDPRRRARSAAGHDRDAPGRLRRRPAPRGQPGRGRARHRRRPAAREADRRRLAHAVHRRRARDPRRRRPPARRLGDGGSGGRLGDPASARRRAVGASAAPQSTPG